MSERHVKVDLVLPSDLTETHRVQAEIESALQENGFNEYDLFNIRLAVEEALVNAMKHGNQLDPDKKVQVSYTITEDQFDIRIVDEGQGFNPEDVPDPTDEGNVDRFCGRGVYIIRNVMDSVAYEGNGNIVLMTKRRGTDPLGVICIDGN
jgi:serine/threonine-protein kinase RsbW